MPKRSDRVVARKWPPDTEQLHWIVRRSSFFFLFFFWIGSIIAFIMKITALLLLPRNIDPHKDQQFFSSRVLETRNARLSIVSNETYSWSNPDSVLVPAQPQSCTTITGHPSPRAYSRDETAHRDPLSPLFPGNDIQNCAKSKGFIVIAPSREQCFPFIPNSKKEQGPVVARSSGKYPKTLHHRNAVLLRWPNGSVMSWRIRCRS